VSRYQKGKTNLDFTGARDSEWQWNPLGHMQVCTSHQTDNHASTPPFSFLQAGCPSCRPTNSVKALKAVAYITHAPYFHSVPWNLLLGNKTGIWPVETCPSYLPKGYFWQDPTVIICCPCGKIPTWDSEFSFGVYRPLFVKSGQDDKFWGYGSEPGYTATTWCPSCSLIPLNILGGIKCNGVKLYLH